MQLFELISGLFIQGAIVYGVTIGVILRVWLTFKDYRTLLYLQFPGRILMNILNFMSLPLTVSCIVTAITDAGTISSGKMMSIMGIYYIFTCFLATATGLILTLIVAPGNKYHDKVANKMLDYPQEDDPEPLAELIRQCIPDNIVTTCFQTVRTEFVPPDCEPAVKHINNSDCWIRNSTTRDITENRTNFVGVVVLTVALGCVINYIESDGRHLKAFLYSLNAVTVYPMRCIICYTPIGLMSLTIVSVVSIQYPVETYYNLLHFVQVTVGALLIHCGFTLPLMYYVLTRNNPLSLAIKLSRALFTAWGTGSSSASLTVTINTLLSCDINREVVYIVAPIGSTINRDGIAVYQAAACIFLAQASNISITISRALSLSLSFTALALCAALKPKMNASIIVHILTSVGFPLGEIDYILSVEWLLHPLRILVSVWGDCFCAAILNHYFSASMEQRAKSLLIYESESPTLSSSTSSTEELESSSSEEDADEEEEEEIIKVHKVVVEKPYKKPEKKIHHHHPSNVDEHARVVRTANVVFVDF